MRSNLQPIDSSPTGPGPEVDCALDNLLRDKLHELSPAKRRLLELFLSGDDLDTALLSTESEHVSPRTATEMELCEIWCEVLGLDTVGVEDNFFDLGGDSILSIRIVAKANRLGMPLTSRQLFEHPTIAELAGFVDAQPRRPLDMPSEGLTPGSAPTFRGDAATWTPEDFPEAELNQEDLQQILRQTAQKVTTNPAGAGGSPDGVAETAALRVAAEMPRPLVLRSARF
jgi:aryl carrier-like protein